MIDVNAFGNEQLGHIDNFSHFLTTDYTATSKRSFRLASVRLIDVNAIGNEQLGHLWTPVSKLKAHYIASFYPMAAYDKNVTISRRP